MASRSWHLPSKVAAEPFVIATTAILAMALAFVAVGRDFGRVTHEAILTTLRSIDANHAVLQRDILRARAGILKSYDPLVDAIVALREAPQRLSKRIQDEALDDDEDLGQPLNSLRASVETDEKLVERFKTVNALLQNSLVVFGRSLAALHASQDDKVRTATPDLGDVGGLMMRYSMTSSDSALEAAIRSRLNSLARSDAASAASDIQTLIVHAGVILEMLPAVDRIIQAIDGSRTLMHAEQMQGRYLEIVDKAAKQNIWSRTPLGVTAFILWLCVVFFIVRLRRQTELLKLRLQLENAITNIKSSINGAPAEAFRERMQGALAALSQEFAVDGIQFAIVQPGRSDIPESYSSSGPFMGSRGPVLEFAGAFHRSAAQIAPDHGRLPRGKKRKPPGCIWTYSENATCAMTGSALADGRVGVLSVRFAGSETRPCPYAATLLATLAPALADLVANAHARREKLALEQRLSQAQRLEALGTLAGGIAHEFNNVLSSIIGYSEMALQALRSASSARTYVEKVLASGDRAKRVVDQILAFGRKRDRPSRPFDIIEAIADCEPLLLVTLADKVVLLKDLPERPATIEGSPIEFQQILLNLCKNAMEASTRGQSVEVRVQSIRIPEKRLLSHGEIPEGRFFCLAVSDQGIGIAEPQLRHIFEPFYTTRSHGGGTGLGLAAVHGLVGGLGGSINVVSVDGAGTTFEIYFPASSELPVPIASFYGGRSTPTGKGQRVAILEGDEFLLRMYEEKVAALGYEPLGCTSTEALLSILAAPDGPPDVAMLDQAAMGGSRDAAKLDAALRGMAIVIVADRHRSSELKAVPAEARLLGKPINSRALAQALFDCLHI